MLKLTPWLLLWAPVLLAQDFVGTWQGTLNPGGRELRIVIKIARDGDKLKATNYSIDQGGPPIPASAISQNGSALKMTVAGIGGSYEGKISADGKTINGTWTQGAPLPLDLTRATDATAWTIPEPAPPPKRMPADAKPSFEVSTIKPAKPEERFSLLVNLSGMMNTTATSLSDLIKFGFNLHPQQISGGPSWLETEKFDVTGKPDTPGMPNVNQLKGMVQKLLAERFELKYHMEKKELSVYAIQPGKTGPKLTANDSNPDGLPGFGGGGPRGMMVRNATMAEFASVLQANVLERPVVDQSGLGKARWDFVLKWTPDASQRGAMGLPQGDGGGAAAAENPDAPPDIFAAFQQQLGLKLQATKAPVDVLVIDHVDKPSEN
jgi:uncharacterized protein (TIGR03435 family)